jgi:hypothetical protein
MQTKAEVGYIGIVNQMDSSEKDAIILACMRILDRPEEWDSDAMSQLAEVFTERGFTIRDSNDDSLFEASELNEYDEGCTTCGGSHLVLSPTSGEPDDCPKCG